MRFEAAGDSTQEAKWVRDEIHATYACATLEAVWGKVFLDQNGWNGSSSPKTLSKRNLDIYKKSVV